MSKKPFSLDITGLDAPADPATLSEVFSGHEGLLLGDLATRPVVSSEDLEWLGVFALNAYSSDRLLSTDTPSGTAPAQSSQRAAQFIDSPVVGIGVYQQNVLIGTTDSSGGFSYSAANGPVTFKAGNLTVGSFDPSAAPSDSIITPFELAGASRDVDLLKDTSAEAQLALKIAKALQMLDQDGNPDNNIVIDDDTLAGVLADGDFDLSGSDSLASVFTVDEIADADATYHLEQSIDQFTGMDNVTDEKAIIDGYIANAEIWLDLNGDGRINLVNDDGVYQVGEDYFTTRYSSSDGRVVLRETFELNGQTLEASDFDVLVRSGVNIDTGIVNTLIFSAPAEATVVTPLTTLVKRATVDHNLSIEEAEAAVKNALVEHGATFSILHQDPIALLQQDADNSEALAAHKAAAKVVQAAMGVAQGLTTAADNANIVSTDTAQIAKLAIDTVMAELVETIVTNFQNTNADPAAAVVIDPTSATVIGGILDVVESEIQTLGNGALDSVVSAVKNGVKSDAVNAGADIDGATSVEDLSIEQAKALDTTAPGVVTVSPAQDGALVSDASPTLTIGLRRSGELAQRHYEGDVLIISIDSATPLTHALTAQDIQHGRTRVDLAALNLSLSDGSHTITVSSKDLAGNISAVTSFGLSVDTTAPAAPSIGSMAAFINDTTPTVTGTAEASSTITLYSGANTVGTTTADSSGNWSVTTDALATGANSLTAVAKDSAGYSSPASVAVTTTVDTTAPAAPTISLTSAITNDTTPTISGTAEALSTIRLYSGNSVVGTASADSSGDWSVTTNALATGANSLTATATDRAGNLSGSSVATSLTIDTAVPVVSAVSVPDAGSYKVGDSLTFTVTTSESVNVSDTPQLALTIGSATRQASYVSGSGTGALVFSYTVQSGDNDSDGLSVGALSLNGGAITDTAGNALNLTLNSVAATAAVLIDTAAPSAPTLVQNGNLVTVTAEADGVLTLVNAGVDITGRFSVIQSPAGTYTATADLAQFAQSETLALSVTVTDTAGNTSAASSAVNVTIDPTVPTVTSVTTPNAGSYNAGDSLSFTVNLSEDVSVTGTPQLALSVGGVTQQASYVSGDGTSALVFSYTVQSGDNDSDGIAVSGLALNGGTVTDSAGNALSIGLNQVGATAAILVDTAAPNAPSITNPGATVGATPTLSGTAEASASVTLTSAGETVGTGTADTSGNWVITTTALSTGTPSVVATATDNAGNTSAASTALAITVDATAPTVVSVTTPAASRSNAGDVLTFTVNTSENVNVTGTPQLALSIGGDTRQASYVSGDGTSSLVFAYTVQQGDNDSDGIAVGTLSLNGGTLSDSVGNALILGLTGVGDTAAVLVDTIAPSVQAISLSGKVITVTGEASGTLKIKDGATDITTKFTVTESSGTYTATANPSQFDGSENLSLTATVTDAAGNESPASTALSGAIDTTVPSQPAASTSGNVLTVTGERGGILKLFDSVTDVTSKFTISEDNGTYTARANVSEFSSPANLDLSLTATLTDASGNVSSASSSAAMTVDNTVYATTQVVTSAAEYASNQPTLEGTGEVGSTVTLLASGSSVGSGVVGSDGTWTIQTSALADGYLQLDLSTDHGGGTTVAQSAVYSMTINTSSFAARTLQKMYDGVEEIHLDSSLYRMGFVEDASNAWVEGVKTTADRLGTVLYGFETTSPNATTAISVDNLDDEARDRAGLMALAETSHNNKTIRVGTFAHDNLFADAVGRDPQSDGLARITANFLTELTGGKHQIGGVEPLRIMSITAGVYFDDQQFDANDHNRRSYIDAIDSNENEGRLHKDMGLYIDSVNSGSQSQIYDFIDDIAGPNRDWGTQYDVIMVRPSIDDAYRDILLDWAADTGGALLFTYDTSPNRPDVVDPHPGTTQYLQSIGIDPVGKVRVATGDYGPSRIDPFQANALKAALGIFIDDQGSASDNRLVRVDDFTLPSEIYDANGLKLADVTWATSDSTAMSATGVVNASGDVTLTATITALDGTTSSVDHYITAVKLLDSDGDSAEPGLRFEFLNWISGQQNRSFGRANQLYETDLSQPEISRQPQEIFDLAAQGNLGSIVTSQLTLDLQSSAGSSFTTARDGFSDINAVDHVMLVTGYLVANSTGNHDLEFGVNRDNMMQVFVETDSGYQEALTDTALKQLTNMDMTAGEAYRVVAMVRKNSNVRSFSMQWKEPGDTVFADIPADNLVARPSVYPVAGRTDGNFFDFIDFTKDPWSVQAAAAANTDLNGDTVWNQDEFDAVYPDIKPVQVSEEISLDLEYYQAPVQNLLLTDAVMADAKTVSLNVYDDATGNLTHSLYNWSLDTSSTITMASFASQLQTKLRADLSDNNLTVSVTGGVITVDDPNLGLVFEELIVGKTAALAPITFDITQTKAQIQAQGAGLRTAAGLSASFPNNADASGAFIGSLANTSRFSFQSSEFELNNVKIYSSKTERFIDDQTWVGNNSSDFADADAYDDKWKVHGTLEKTLNYYTGLRWDVQFDGGNGGTQKLVYKVHKGGSGGWETVTPTLAKIHSSTLYDDLIENVSEAGRKGSTISLGDITGQISVDATDLAASSPFSVLEQPLFGVVSIAADGSYRYNPTDARFQGFDQFHIQVTDVAGRTHVVPVTIGTNDGVVEETSQTAVVEFADPTYVAPATSEYNTSTAGSAWTFEDLFFAQVAVHRPDSPYLNLVEGRWVKLKLNISALSASVDAPMFEVVVKDIDGQIVGTRVLTGPGTIPTELDLPGIDNLATGAGHNDADSYTVPIPAAWVSPGNKIEILANGVSLADRADFTAKNYADSDGYITPNIVGGGSPDISIGHFTLGAYNDTFLYISTNDFAADILASVPAQKVELLYRSGSTLVETIRNRTMWDSPSTISSDHSIAGGAASYIETFTKPFGWGYPGWARNLAIAVKKANFMSPLPGGMNYPDWMYASLSPDVGGGVGGGQTGSGNTASTATIHEFLGHGGGIGHPTEQAYSFAYNWKHTANDTTPLNQLTTLMSGTLANYNNGTATVTGPFKVFEVNLSSSLWDNKLTVGDSYALVLDDGDIHAIKVTVDSGSGAYVVDSDAAVIDLNANEASAVVALSQDLRFIITDNDANNTEYMKQGSLGDNWYYDQNNDVYVTNYYIANLKEIVEKLRGAIAIAVSSNGSHPDELAAIANNDAALIQVWQDLRSFQIQVATPGALGPVINQAEVLAIASRLPTIHETEKVDVNNDGTRTLEYKLDGSSQKVVAKTDGWLLQATPPVYDLRTGPMAGSQGTGSPGREDDEGLAFARFSDVEINDALVDRFSNIMQWRPNAVAGADTEDGGYAGDGYYQYFGLDQDVYTVADLTGVSGDTRKITGIKTNLLETNVVDFYSDEAVGEGHNHTDNIADDHTHTDDVTDDHDHDNSADHLGDSNIFLTGDNGKRLNTTAIGDTFTAWTTGQDNVRIAGARTNQSVISFEVQLSDGSIVPVDLVKGWQTVTAANDQGTIEALMPHQVGVEIYSVILNIQDTHGHEHERGAPFHADVPMFVYKTVGNLPAAYYDYLKPNSGIVFDAIADYALRVTYQTANGLVTDHIQIPAKNSGGINLPVKGELVRMDLLDATGGKQAYLENNVISSFVNPTALANLVLGGNDWFGVISDVELPDYHNGHALTWSASANNFIDLTTGAVTLANLTANSSITATWTENGSQQQTTIGLAALSDELLSASLFPHGSIIVDDVALPDSMFGYDVVWSSNATSVLTNAGVNAATAAGTATLTATLQNSDGTARSISKSFDVVPDTALASGLQFDVFDLGSVYANADIAGDKEFKADDDKLGYVALLQGGLDFENTNKLFEGTARNVVWHAQDARDFNAYTVATVGGSQKLFGNNETEFRRFVNAAYRGREDDTNIDVVGDIAENSLYVFSGLLRPDTTDDYHFNLDMRVEGSFAIEVNGQMHHFQSTNNLKTHHDPIALEAGGSYKIWASVLMSRETVGANNVDRYDTVDLKWSTADQPGDNDWTYIPEGLLKHTPNVDMWSGGNAPYATSGRVTFLEHDDDFQLSDSTTFDFEITGLGFGEYTAYLDNTDNSGAANSEGASSVTLDGTLELDFSEFDASAVKSGTTQTLDLIVADTITGTFDTIKKVGLDSALTATVTYVTPSDGSDDVLRLTLG
ncbi:Ig-like domain-containing protein [Litorivicinus lipolyticus]|nr:Ig-like domain-containing protein [Litorivicinus lipolyticus]